MSVRIKQWIAILLAVLLACLPTACAGISESAPESEYMPAINPMTTAGGSQIDTLTLYYPIENENALAGYTRRVRIQGSESRQQVLLRELAQQPESGLDLAAALPEGTQVGEVYSDNEVLYVTLSEEFIQTPAAWANLDARALAQHKRLALYAVVNTLTHSDEYQQVQILIASDANAHGARPTRGQVGFTEQADALLEPLSRNNELVFTPDTAVQILFEGALEQNALRMRRMLAGGENRPSEQEIQDRFKRSNAVLQRYVVTQTVMSADGQSATVYVDVAWEGQDGRTVQKFNQPVEVRQESGVWRVEDDSIGNLLYPQI